MKSLLDAIENGALEWDDTTRDEVRTLIEGVAAERASAAMSHVTDYVADADYAALLEQANEDAVQWSEARVGNLITDVSATTRDTVNELTGAAIENGWTNDEFASEMEDAFGFSDDRADMIARTETAFAETAGTLAGYKASGVVGGKMWSADDDPCPECEALDGVVVGLDEDFPDGGGDGAPLHPNCFLPGTPVSTAGRIAAYYERWFAGEVVRIRVESGHDLAVTPNHPILTLRGWVAAGQLLEGDYLVQAPDPAVAVRLLDPENHEMETPIEQLTRAALMASSVAPLRVPLTAEHFHGDGAGSGEVEIVATDRFLRGRSDPASLQLEHDPSFNVAHAELPSLPSDRAAHDALFASGATSNSSMGRLGTSCTFSGPDAGSLDTMGIAVRTDAQAETTEPIADRTGMATALARQIDARLAGHVAAVKVTHVRLGEHWSGHVYNLGTEGGWYLANSIVVHNCECGVVPVLSDDAASLIDEG